MRRTVELRVAGLNYRVVSSASEEELRRLAEVVSSKLASLGAAGRGGSHQSLLLAAMALAHDAEEERSLRIGLERKTRDVLRRMLSRVDSALEPLEGAASPRG